MTLLRYDAKQKRLWIATQRVHHGPIGCFLAAALAKRHPRWAVLVALWGITDIHDVKVWFKPGSQELNLY